MAPIVFIWFVELKTPTSKIWTFVFMIYIVIMQKENHDLSRYDKKFNSKNSFPIYAISLEQTNHHQSHDQGSCAVETSFKLSLSSLRDVICSFFSFLCFSFFFCLRCVVSCKMADERMLAFMGHHILSTSSSWWYYLCGLLVGVWWCPDCF